MSPPSERPGAAGFDVAVIGAGYVGLTTAACLAHLGHRVLCADILPDRVAALSRGEVPIVEQGLDQLVAEGLETGRLEFVLGAASAAAQSEFVYLSVPTPQGADGSADLSFIEAVAREIGPVLPADAVVINKSTVPVGSTRVVEKELGRSDVYVVSNPEFLREGSAVTDFLEPDRVVIGSDDQSAAIRVAALYVGVPAPLMVTDPASAETIKYASNAFLATKLSFVNAVAAVCEAVGADVNDVVLGMGYDERIGHEFLKPGPGWGGSCFAGDETVVLRRGDEVSLLSFAELESVVDDHGVLGLEVLSWVQDDPTPAFSAVSAFTSRPYDGPLVTLRTKMGRRLTVTADHPMVVNGSDPHGRATVISAGELTKDHWVPLALGAPLPLPAEDSVADLLSVVRQGHISADEVIVRVDRETASELERRRSDIHHTRRRDILRSGALRLAELDQLGIDAGHGSFATTTNGTYVPDRFPIEERFWRMIGLYLAEGWTSIDGRRHRINWAFHPRDEEDLVEFVAGFWRDLGVKVSVRTTPTSRLVSVSSRVLAFWMRDVLELGSCSYEKALPVGAFALTAPEKQALLRGLWDGDGSWSLISGGPSVAIEYGTVSHRLAEGMLRLLADLGIVARVKVGRTAKSTVDTYWLVISGADQVEAASEWLFPPQEAAEIVGHIARQAKRIRPTGYRRDGKNAAWVRIDAIETEQADTTVYSLEVPGPHTVVTTGGLVAHNCFPKDSSALVRIAEEAGYDFGLLKGVIAVNDEQFDRVADKIEAMVGGDVDGRTVAVWGLTFKARTDDLRESPSLEVIGRLAARGAVIKAHDPTVTTPPDGGVWDAIEVGADPYAVCDGADVLAVLTEWDEYRWLDFDKVADAMAVPRIVDTRNLLERASLQRRGFDYTGIGRG